MKIELTITFTNLIGAIAFVVGSCLTFFKIEGGSAIAMCGLGLVGTKKVNDMFQPKNEADA